MPELTQINAAVSPSNVPVCLVEGLDTANQISAEIANPRNETVSVDTEADSLHHYAEKVCLLQLAVGGRAFIADPLALGEATKTILRALKDRLLLLHGADYDLRLLHRGFGFRATRIFDTMIAAQLLGEKEVGLAALLASRLGVRLDKTHQRADWSLRPLGPELLAYAAADVLYLEELAFKLRSDLEKVSRLSWHEEECARLLAQPMTAKGFDPETSWRIKGTNSLSNKERAFARALWFARDARARSLDRPAFRVFTNEKLLDACRGAAKGERSLEKLFGLKRPFPESTAALVVQALEMASKVPPGEWPAPRRENETTETEPALKAEIERLKARRDLLARQTGLDPGVVASRAVLSSVARLTLRGDTRDAGEIARETGASSWRVKLLLA